MADRDIVGDAVRSVADAPRKFIEEKREAAGRARLSQEDRARYGERVSDRAKKAMSSSKSSGRKSSSRLESRNLE